MTYEGLAYDLGSWTFIALLVGGSVFGIYYAIKRNKKTKSVLP